MFRLSALCAFAALAAGCNDKPACNPNDLENRAYIVSHDSDEVHVIDLACLEITGVVKTGGLANHMLDLNRDFTKAWVDSSDTNETVVFDARTLQVTKKIVTPRHPTHLSLSRDGRIVAVMGEDDDAVMFLDADSDALIKTLPGFKTPHFARFSRDGRWAFVANINGHHITRVDMQSLSIAEHIALDGFGINVEAPDEGGFADAQIDDDGMLYAAHNATGKVLVYDTRKLEKKRELSVGRKPWIVYAEHPFGDLRKRHVVPSFGDRTASIIDAASVLASLPIADEESFGVNYSSLAPDQAFLMNRFKKEIAVVDTAQMRAMDRIDVGGTTETASTTPDGRWIVATVSSANAVVVIDAVTHAIVKRFENVGRYPWSVTIPRGQNYCH